MDPFPSISLRILPQLLIHLLHRLQRIHLPLRTPLARKQRKHSDVRSHIHYTSILPQPRSQPQIPLLLIDLLILIFRLPPALLLNLHSVPQSIPLPSSLSLSLPPLSSLLPQHYIPHQSFLSSSSP